MFPYFVFYMRRLMRKILIFILQIRYFSKNHLDSIPLNFELRWSFEANKKTVA